MSWLKRERIAGNVNSIIEIVGVLIIIGVIVYFVLT